MIEQPASKNKSKKASDPVLAYARDVIAGRIVAGPHVRNACHRHLADIKHQKSRGLHWDLAAALWFIEFCHDVLCLAGGQFEGMPFKLEPSQAFIGGSLFGWKRADDTRRFRRAFIEGGKGCGKTPLAAAIGLYGLVADGEDRAEIYAAGKDKEQAMVLFRDAVSMVEQSPRLSSELKKSGLAPSVWNLAFLKTGSFYRPIAKDGAVSGPRPHFALCDEIHEHHDGSVVEMLERGFKFRRQPLLLMITNSGSDRQTKCWQEHVHAIRAAAGDSGLEGKEGESWNYHGDLDVAKVYDDSFSYVCALDQDDDPLEDPACWIKANPLLGKTITEDYLAGVVRQAKAIPGLANGILRLHFCQWTDAERAWMARGTLEQVLGEFDPAQFSGETIFAGADLSGTKDLTCVAYICETGTVALPRERTLADGSIQVDMVHLPTYHAWVDSWTPQETLAERALIDQAPYQDWVQLGWLRATPGQKIRLDFVAARIAEQAAEYRFEWLAYDRYCYARLADCLDELGVTIRQIEHPQGGRRRAALPEELALDAKLDGKKPIGLWMPGSLASLETLILEKRITIHKNPVLISAFSAAATEEDPFGNRWFSKQKATKRIDPLVALAMAVGAAEMAGSQTQGPSVYEELAAIAKRAAVTPPARTNPVYEMNDRRNWDEFN
jgi:phage terminase large subunit-like protein